MSDPIHDQARAVAEKIVNRLCAGTCANPHELRDEIEQALYATEQRVWGEAARGYVRLAEQCEAKAKEYET